MSNSDCINEMEDTFSVYFLEIEETIKNLGFDNSAENVMELAKLFYIGGFVNGAKNIRDLFKESVIKNPLNFPENLSNFTGHAKSKDKE